jgi:hypothetical protein
VRLDEQRSRKSAAPQKTSRKVAGSGVAIEPKAGTVCTVHVSKPLRSSAPCSSATLAASMELKRIGDGAMPDWTAPESV